MEEDPRIIALIAAVAFSTLKEARSVASVNEGKHNTSLWKLAARLEILRR
ncbi:MAG: hypothetical protein J7L11_03980 [Thermoprotei archaeon]|nr:hypothetical protein [Thermoprotei archaeon]